MHDLSYYKGKLYLYFGVTPALLLFWPWVTLTGHYLFHRYAVAIFCAVGFLAGAALLRALWRRYFPEVSVAVVAAGMVALGLASGVPIMQQRAEFWEAAVSCGHALIMLALGAVWLALHDAAAPGLVAGRGESGAGSGRGRASVPAARSGDFAGAVGAGVAAADRGGPAPYAVGLLVAALLPLALCGLGLMLYNYLRFDNPFEFGQRYQLAASVRTPAGISACIISGSISGSISWSRCAGAGSFRSPATSCRRRCRPGMRLWKIPSAC